MGEVFHGRILIPANIEGEAVVSRHPFNNLASFYQTVRENAPTVICSDQNNADLYGKELTGKIVCVKSSIGSTSAGAMWEEIAYRGLAPRAILFSERIDSLAAAGLVLAQIWAEHPVVAADMLGNDFLETVKDGDKVQIFANGEVEVCRK